MVSVQKFFRIRSDGDEGFTITILKRFQAKACPGPDPGWRPVCVKKTRQIKNLAPGFDSIETEKVLARLGVEELENLTRAFRADAGNLAEIGDRRPLDLLQGSEMMQQGTFA
jgi:hypothetical protein